MRSFAPYLLGLLGATTASFAYVGPAASEVVSLTEDTFEDFMEEHDLVLANFYAPWCRYSRMLAPNFAEAATELKNDNIPLVNVDCTWEEDLCAEYDISAYPTLMVFRGPGLHKPYGGGRQTDSIISYMIHESTFTEPRSGLRVQN
ncbi:hypothetical protein N7457_006965 [Penicillium paradoxum]|uniref:uncharacterized protein n=1 Tax=Penicillium paradoxum TaxID=176176 RepID=UPI002548F1A3|nr:uncharacterized protein N7457_006965 [Penicillium paradoxum]KAJ5779245.1 hypothetical protein N7457_006965 [Penicillium paradoxum]